MTLSGPKQTVAGRWAMQAPSSSDRTGPLQSENISAAPRRPGTRGLAAMGRAGSGLIIDEVFLGGGWSQQRLAAALAGLPVVWVGVHCDPEVAAVRERSRSDRVGGMARLQALRVHEGVVYDLVVDTTAASAADCAGAIASHLAALRDSPRG
jgi:chloramphenicol 3-O phosphotransferase